MTKHTPGPWIAVGYQVEVERDDVPDICSCDPENIDQEHLNWDEKTVMANARLIAAAPDLLEALREFLECGVNAGSNEELKQKCRAAIAKATE